ncbi:MAG: hypothetical protein NTY64_11075 [Deltaproteobacteria bacterium]|nr:hypothetical protein [Deltaproteobacteria bacterium]
MLHGTRDDVVPVDHAHRLYACVQGKAELFIIEGAGHRLRVEEKAMEKAEEWLKKKAISLQQLAKGFIIDDLAKSRQKDGCVKSSPAFRGTRRAKPEE